MDRQSPNLGACLLHQKFQMLNYCILKKRQAQGIEAEHLKDYQEPFGKSYSSEDQESETEGNEEFYDPLDSLEGSEDCTSLSFPLPPFEQSKE